MLNILDFGILIGYVLMVISVGCGAAWFQKRKAARLGTAQDGGAYFLAARTLAWPIIGLSLFSTNISTVHIVALCEEGFRSGLAFANFELAAVFTLVILAVFFVPFYLRAHVTTLPDFLEKRFNRNCRDFLAFISIISAIFIHIGVSLYAGAVVINAMLGFGTEVEQLMPTMIAIAAATGLYVVVGGLLAVTLTDAIQTTTLLIGSAVVTYFAFTKLGGWSELNNAVGPHMLSVLRPTGDFSGMPWHAVILGYPVIGIWYWCTDQTIVQRVLGAKNEDHGKAGALFAGFLKLLPMFLFVLPGLLCLALVNNGLLPELADTKEAFAHMVMNLLPAGMKGLIVAALLAALMGTIAGALNSIATLFAFDLYKRFKPDTSDKKLVHIGRIATISGVVLAIIWSPIIGKFDSIYGAIASMICYIAPPITAVFMVGIFWKRATAKAGAITLWSGFAMGMIVFALDLYKTQTGWSMLFMHAAGMLCGICILIMIVVSLMDKDTNTEENLKLVWDSPMTPLRIPGAKGLLNYKFLSLAVMLAASIIYFLFRAPSEEKMNTWAGKNPNQAEMFVIHTQMPQKLLSGFIADIAEGKCGNDDITQQIKAIRSDDVDLESSIASQIQLTTKAVVRDWLSNYDEAIIDAGKSPLSTPDWGHYTKKESTLFAHVFDWPKETKDTPPQLSVDSKDIRIEKAYLLADTLKSPLETQSTDTGIAITLPKQAPDHIDSVIVIECRIAE